MPTPPPMPDPRPDLSEAAERLTAARAGVLARIVQMDGDLVAVIDASRDSNADDEHDPEGQTIAFERSQLAALTDRAREQLAEIDAALDRVAADTYGTCELCHQPIPALRLEARPTARTCVDHTGPSPTGRA
jgi:RNA polymerase-binding transcription factor DksA